MKAGKNLDTSSSSSLSFKHFQYMCMYEGREGVKWEPGFAFFRGWEVGFCALPLGFMKQKQ